MRLPIPAALRSRRKQLGESLAILLGLWFRAAFVAMFFAERYPTLHPFVTWTFWAYAGLFAAFILGITIIGPGVFAAKEVFEFVVEPDCSTRRFLRFRKRRLGSKP